MAVKSETTAPTADALARFELFRDLPSEALSALSRRCQWRRYHAHQIILGYQDDSREVFFVVRGQVRVTFFSEAAGVSFRDLPAGEMFGELSAIDGLPRSCTVVALADTMVAVMTASLLWDLLRAHGSGECVYPRTAHPPGALAVRARDRIEHPVRKRIQAELLPYEAAPGQKCAMIFPAHPC